MSAGCRLGLSEIEYDDGVVVGVPGGLPGGASGRAATVTMVSMMPVSALTVATVPVPAARAFMPMSVTRANLNLNGACAPL